MKHFAKMMWVCAAVIALVVVLAATGSSAAYLLVSLPCVLVMGAMMWMMMRSGVG